MPDQICTTDQVKLRLFPAGTTDTTDDALIGELINQVTAWMESYTGRRLVPEAGATYTFDTQAGYVLRIPRGIRAITSMGVALSHQPDTGGAYTTIPASDRIIRPKAVDLPEGWPPTEVRFSRGTLTGSISAFATADNGCTITGDFGPAASPLELVAVGIDAVVAAFQSRKNGASSVMGADDMALPPWSKFFGQGSPQRGTLDRYRYMAL